MELPKNGILIMGNESEGIRKELLELADYNLFIPSFGNAESLNVAVSTGILFSELRSE